MTSTSCLTAEQTCLELPLLSVDIGERRIGVAVCDRLGLSCHGIACLQRPHADWMKQLQRITLEYGCQGIIAGLPRNMDGTEGKQAADCRNIADQIRHSSGLPVELWDERLSTWSARDRLKIQGLSEKKIAGRVDQTAAAIILEDFLAAHPPTPPGTGA